MQIWNDINIDPLFEKVDVKKTNNKKLIFAGRNQLFCFCIYTGFNLFYNLYQRLYVKKCFNSHFMF